MKEYIKQFNQYFKKFDIKDKNIIGKFHHSYRVMEYAKEIGKSLELNDHDIWLCEMIGLYHDIGRFYQWTKYKTYNDSKSVDHGDLSYQILIDEHILENIDNKDKKIILEAIKYHNKYSISDTLNDRELMFSKIIRDADKIDILLEQGNTIYESQDKLSPYLLEEIYSKRQCSNHYCKTDIDIILRQMGFLFDINNLYVFKVLKEKNWLHNKFNLLENYVNDKNEVNRLKIFMTEYIEKRVTC